MVVQYIMNTTRSLLSHHKNSFLSRLIHNNGVAGFNPGSEEIHHTICRFVILRSLHSGRKITENKLVQIEVEHVHRNWTRQRRSDISASVRIQTMFSWQTWVFHGCQVLRRRNPRASHPPVITMSRCNSSLSPKMEDFPCQLIRSAKNTHKWQGPEFNPRTLSEQKLLHNCPH
jgi:hypothetical protein